jgi:hypothetical protein
MDRMVSALPPKVARVLSTKRGRVAASILTTFILVVIVRAIFKALGTQPHIYAWPVTHLRAPGASNSSTAALGGGSAAADCIPERPSFIDVASLYTTDKTQHSPHHYEFAYQALVAPRRCSATSMLEIGLGCGMGYGPGHSVPLWAKYLPHATISIFEFDFPCLTEFLERDPIVSALQPADKARLHFFSGDQSDPEALLRAAAATGPYDVIVDDGGHTMLQQIVSLSVLLRHVKPGGIYVLEDLATSFEPGMADLPVSTVEFVARITACLHLAPFRDRTDSPHFDAHSPPRVADDRINDACELARLVESISCWEEVCIFTRWAGGAEPPPWRGVHH